MIWKTCCGHLLGLALIAPAAAQAPPKDQPPSEPVAESFGGLSARAAVREGNAKLLEGDAVTALEAYSHAADLRPDPPHISLAPGPAHSATATGRVGLQRPAARRATVGGPVGMWQSAGLTEAARTRTSTRSSATVGWSMSLSSRTSGEPYS